MNINALTEEQLAVLGVQLGYILQLKVHNDCYVTTWGNKSPMGLASTATNIINDFLASQAICQS